MGDPRKTRKQFKRPLTIWNTASIAREKILKETFGLKNKREIWKTETNLRKKKTQCKKPFGIATGRKIEKRKRTYWKSFKNGNFK